ncbi:CoA-binding protein [Gilvibacter sp.]|uniref:CoA-binding protein n=1 Tax=Gilvibacter sp. TaxID=2729997 RepID=UPI003F4A5E22
METAKNTTLVLGASLKSNRYSYYAIERLVAHDQPVVAIGLRAGTVAGIPIETTPVPFDGIDTVTLYLNPQRQQQYYDYIIGLKPRRVIFNPGTENLEFENKLRANGILADRACTLVLLSTNQY